MSRQVDDEPQGRRQQRGRARWITAVTAVVTAPAVMLVVTRNTTVVALVMVAVVPVAVAMVTVANRRKESVGRESVRDTKRMRNPAPPLSAEKLLLFALPPRISDPIVGDLTERFPSIQKRHGVWFARAWYWRHAVGAVTRFIGPRLAGATSLGAVVRMARKFLPL
jgi:hypothetical protein